MKQGIYLLSQILITSFCLSSPLNGQEQPASSQDINQPAGQVQTDDNASQETQKSESQPQDGQSEAKELASSQDITRPTDQTQTDDNAKKEPQKLQAEQQSGQSETTETESAEDSQESQKQPNNDQLNEQVATQDDKTSEQQEHSKTEETTQDEERSLQEAQPLNHPYYLDAYARPWKDAAEAPERISFEFEDAQLINVIRYVEKQFNLTFILDDVLDPVPKGGQSALGTKVTFRTHEPLTREQAWNVFLSFLDMAGLGPRPGPYKDSYRITTTNAKSEMSIFRDPLPTYIGVHPDQLPSSDMRVRYVYFIRNASMDVIRNIMVQMQSAQAPQPIAFPEMRAIMMSEKAYNIQAIMRVVRELDTVTQPETMSVIKLKKTDAQRVAKLYQSLIQEDEKQQNLSSRLLSGRHEQKVRYFPTGTRVIPEPRTNTLIILGTQESIAKIEEFITQEIDRDINVPFKPTHIYTLNHVKADAAKTLLDEALKFQGSSQEAAKHGGVRDGDQYFKPVSIIAEPTGNRLIITADYTDYYKIEDLLNQLDIEQPQVAIKVLLININLNDQREAGTQIRNKVPGTEGLLSDHVNFQTSGLAGNSNVITNDSSTTGAQRLLGDLINLAAQSTSIGSTFLTLGSDKFGVWGLFRLLQTYTHSNIISNPFLVTTNKTAAQIEIGETRRVPEAIVKGNQETTSFKDLSANLEVKITPQISYEGYVTLDLRVTDAQFTAAAGDAPSSGNRNERIVENSVIMADKDILALGGLIRTSIQETESGIPVLKDIPGFGYLFKNKSKTYGRESLLILISPEIIPPENTHIAGRYTDTKAEEAKETVTTDAYGYIRQDPFHRWFFKDADDEGVDLVKDYMAREKRYTTFPEESNTKSTSEQEHIPDTTQKSTTPNQQKSTKRGKQKLSRFLSNKDAS